MNRSSPAEETHLMQSLPLSSPQPALDLDHVGLIAGEGKFPFLLARAARDRNISLTAIGVRGITPVELADEVDAMLWVEFGQLGKMIDLCHQAGVDKVIMAGRIQHRSIFQLSRIDRRGLKILASLPTKKADSLLGALTDELAREKIEVLDSTMLMRECMPPAGLLTPSCPPSDAVLGDIAFGRPIASQVAGLDIGQTIVVKQGTIVAVEAMEGTDKTILRAGQIAGEGCVVIKVSKPRQDRRFDVPVAGMTTVRKLVEARCAALAIPGGEALFFDRDEACALAQKHGICIYAW
ncbi:MAG: UDP-2,3-diacylglucosamine diphosphatase LpxI [Candidatus Sumerlaeia bacterium]